MALQEATDKSDLKYEVITNTLSYENYKPAYNFEGEKILSITASESNYFNILQTIAEKF
jgi:hypothetical protein